MAFHINLIKANLSLQMSYTAIISYFTFVHYCLATCSISYREKKKKIRVTKSNSLMASVNVRMLLRLSYIDTHTII